MDPEIRGLLESTIDALTSEKVLEMLFRAVRSYKPLVKSDQDAVFGCILGGTLTLFNANYQTKFNREPQDSEIQTYINMLRERSALIMSKINTHANL